MGLQARTALNVVVLLLFGASASWQKPVEPAVDPLPPIDASDEVRTIQLEEQRRGQEVERVARSQAARELESTSKALAPAPVGDGGRDSLDGGEPLAHGEGGDKLAGKLERAIGNQIIIRDSSGFEYWLNISDTTHLSRNGEPARLADLKQGADVRASFVWRGKERVATDVEALDAGQLTDGGS